jgi:arylsulfatase A-like enzyme
MADNGRAFPHSKTRVNDRGMKTPFIISYPKTIKEASICNSLVSSIDIAPTITSLAINKSHKQFQGKSFEKLFKDPTQEFRNYIIAEHNWHDYEAHERMIRDKNYMYILNSRPQYQQLEPLDAVGSPTFKELKKLKKLGKLTENQAEIFITPRPIEELYDLNSDNLQHHNLSNNDEYKTQLLKMRILLNQWMKETGDDIPENLTLDWYKRISGKHKTKQHSIRKTMPGSKLNATKINNSSLF